MYLDSSGGLGCEEVTRSSSSSEVDEIEPCEGSVVFHPMLTTVRQKVCRAFYSRHGLMYIGSSFMLQTVHPVPLVFRGKELVESQHVGPRL